MNEYQTLIESAPVVLVEFFATWCPHCRHMIPVVADVKERVNGVAEIYQLDIDKNAELADAVDISTVPTFILYRDGREVWRQSGEIAGDELLSRIER
ncbi:thioredoxin family protein [Muribaculum sp.]|uniref:thioredoxin family protein n=1 Tax=Muribaculum sp. TaxID=1918611 RepID=UPI0023D19BBD|nr:thioredoxin family protein [Muribaculum sp.]MDE5706469.1 thioredoxin family protein [Muribaculum sp.]